MESFNNLRKNFANSVCLSHVIPGARYKLQCDGSLLGIGRVLYQIDNEGNHRIVSIASRCLTSEESRYTTTEIELLAIVYCVMKFRYYLIGVKFEIITDHNGLTFLTTTVYNNSRLIRWSLLLQQYCYTVSHCRGTDNIMADFLSRNPAGRFHEGIDEKLMIGLLNRFTFPHQNDETVPLVIMALHKQDHTLKKILKNLEKLQLEDEYCSKIMKNIKTRIANGFEIYEHVLFHSEKRNENYRIVMPMSITNKLVAYVHSKLGHPGVFKTFTYVKRFYYWKTMHRQIKQFVLSCDLCQIVKYISVAMEGSYNQVASNHPSDLVTVDYYGPLPRARGNVEYVFVVLDVFSKLVRLYPLKRATTLSSLDKILNKAIPECGKFNRILSDNGIQFKSKKWKDSLEDKGIKVLYSSIRHPQSNPTERVMRELGRLFRTFCKNKHTTWNDYIKTMEDLLNKTTHFSTNLSPNELHFGKSTQDEVLKLVKFPSLPGIDHKVIITLAKENLKKNFEKRLKNQKVVSKVVLNKNDLVMLRVRHLSNALDKVTKKFFHL